MKNKFALIGYTGFIGSNLISYKKNIDKFNSKNINKIANNRYDIVICAGTSSKRWIANKYPKEDKKKILNLINNLKQIRTKKFILISTCEVFDNSKVSNENTKIFKKGKDYYSKNRILLENFCKKKFKNIHIIRLPIVYGTNFSKNFIFDLLNNNQINKLNGKDIVQIYNVKNLIKDIKYVIKNNIKYLNISSPPVKMKIIANRFFNIKLPEKDPFRKMKMTSLNLPNKSKYFVSRIKTLNDLNIFIKQYK